MMLTQFARIFDVNGKNNGIMSEVYSEPCRASMMELCAKVINGFQTLTILAKDSIIDDWQGANYSTKCEKCQQWKYDV